MTRIAVASRTFSRHPILREELLAHHADVTFNETGQSLKGDDLIAFLKDHDAAIIALEKMTDEVFAAVPELKTISKFGVGFDGIDVEAMIHRGIQLGWTGGVNKRSVSELVIAFAVTLLRNIPETNRQIRQGEWQIPKGGLLADRTVGIIGCGHVGKDLATLLQAFGCRLLVNDILDFPDFYKQYGLEPVDLDTLLRQSDIVTLHVPLDSSTRNMLSAEKLNLMQSHAVLVNAARGGLVDETALKTMLKENRLAGAAFDVFATEPPDDLELLNLPNFMATPHIGGSAEEAILAMGRAAIAGLDEARLPDTDWPPRS